MTLLRASIDPDPLPDLGKHIIEYALIPHSEGWTVSDCIRAGEDMNIPLVVTSCGFHSGDLPSAKSFVTIMDKNVRLAAMKMSQDGAAQDGRTIILRLVEVEGKETEARLTLAPELLPRGTNGETTAVEVDTLERSLDVNNARLEGNTLVAKLPAFGITTVRISEKPAELLEAS